MRRKRKGITLIRLFKVKSFKVINEVIGAVLFLIAMALSDLVTKDIFGC